MKLNSKILMIMIVILFFGGIGFTKLMGWWDAKNSGGQPNRLNIDQVNGDYDPADIRGSFTYGDVSTLFNIPMEDLIVAFQLPDGSNVAVYRINSLESVFEGTEYEFGTSSIELFVAYYKGLPYDRTEESYLLETAVEILKAQGNLTEEQEAYLASHTIPLETFQALQNGETPVLVDDASGNPLSGEEDGDDEHVEVLYEISGETTFQDIMDWGVSQETIENALGGDMPNPATVIREYCSREGLQYDEIKETLQAEINQFHP